jgi:2-methylcitrate dehydratase PrpD
VAPSRAGAATLLGVDGDDAPAERALRVGTAAHALDYDDLSWGMDGHPSVTLVPPLLALLEETEPTGAEFVTAYAAGFEAECALAAPVSPEHYEAGWHATATFGAMGAAAAAASLLGLDADGVRRALTVAASTPAGLKRNFGSMTKPLHAGLCARSGVTAARLAAEGFTADATAVSGDRGFWDLYGPADREGFAFDPEDWALDAEGIHVKRYPCCYFTHTPIAATRGLVADHDVAPADVERIEVSASQGAADALDHANPETGLQAKFSMEYAVASAVVRDSVGLAAFEDDAVGDDAVRSVRERVSFAVDGDLAYDDHAATVRVVTRTGSHERHRANPPWTHDAPPTAAALREKFTACARRAVPADEASRLADVLAGVDDVTDVRGALAGAARP